MTEASPDTVKVFDTRVNGRHSMLHFDVMTTDDITALRLAKQYVDSIGEGDATVTMKECRFCHSEPAVFFTGAATPTKRARRLYRPALLVGVR